jgi:hypothetical protein
VWYMLLDVGSDKDGKRPKEVTEVGIEQHGMCHAADCEVCSFHYSILQ